MAYDQQLADAQREIERLRERVEELEQGFNRVVDAWREQDAAIRREVGASERCVALYSDGKMCGEDSAWHLSNRGPLKLHDFTPEPAIDAIRRVIEENRQLRMNASKFADLGGAALNEIAAVRAEIGASRCVKCGDMLHCDGKGLTCKPRPDGPCHDHAFEEEPLLPAIRRVVAERDRLRKPQP